MASPGSYAFKLKITINYDGVFTRPIDYQAGIVKKMCLCFDELDYDCFIEWVGKVTGKHHFVVYYVVPHKNMCGGLRMLKCDEDVARFVDHAVNNNGKITIYTDGYDDNLTDFLGEDTICDAKTQESTILNRGKQKMEVQSDAVKEKETNDELDELSDSLSIDLEPEDVIPKLNKLTDDAFLNRLCDITEVKTSVDDNEEDEDVGRDYVDEEEDNDELDNESGYPIFNPEVDWKSMKPMLGLRFESPAQLRHMITCYSVANGYPLTIVKSQSYRFVVRCSKDGQGGFTCPFKLRGSW